MRYRTPVFLSGKLKADRAFVLERFRKYVVKGEKAGKRNVVAESGQLSPRKPKARQAHRLPEELQRVQQHTIYLTTSLRHEHRPASRNPKYHEFSGAPDLHGWIITPLSGMMSPCPERAGTVHKLPLALLFVAEYTEASSLSTDLVADET